MPPDFVTLAESVVVKGNEMQHIKRNETDYKTQRCKGTVILHLHLRPTTTRLCD